MTLRDAKRLGCTNRPPKRYAVQGRRVVLKILGTEDTHIRTQLALWGGGGALTYPEFAVVRQGGQSRKKEGDLAHRQRVGASFFRC